MNRRTTLRRAAQLCMLVALALLAACGTAAPSAPASATAPAASGATIRLGYQPTVVFAPVYVGIERGYFAQESINVELTQIQATQDAVVQLAAGNFDVALAGGNAGVFNAIARGLKFKVVAPVHSEKPPVATPLVISAKRSGEIKRIADLKGKKIGIVGNGAAIEYWVERALAQDGLKISDVQLQAMPFPNMPAALENGALDAAVITEPLVTINKDKGLLSVLSDNFIDGFTATYVYMNEAWMQQNPQLAKGFLKGYLRATRDLQGDYMTPEIAGIIEKYTKVPAAVVQRAALAQYKPDGKVPVQDLETLQTFFMERGVLEYKDLLDVNSFVDTTLAAEVAAELAK